MKKFKVSLEESYAYFEDENGTYDVELPEELYTSWQCAIHEYWSINSMIEDKIADARNAGKSITSKDVKDIK